MKTPEDGDPIGTLLLRVGDGDREALGTLYQTSAGKLLGVLLQMLRDRDAAEDVLHEVFVSVWHKADQYDSTKGKGLSWLVVLTRRRGLDFIRKQKRDRAKVEAVISWHEVFTEFSEPKRLEMDLNAALERLPTEQREAISLAFGIGMSHREIADHLKKPLGTIKARIRRGLESLHLNLQEQRSDAS